MTNVLGTRKKQNFTQQHQEYASFNEGYTRDPGMTKRVISNATFTAATSRIAGANGDFTNFAVNDAVLVLGTNKNNGLHTVTAIDAVNGAFLVLDPAPKDEGPVANTQIRTP